MQLLSRPFSVTQELTVGPQLKTIDSSSPLTEAPQVGARPLDPFRGRSGNAMVVGRCFPRPKTKRGVVSKTTCKYRGACSKRRIKSYSHSFTCLGKALPILPWAYLTVGREWRGQVFPSMKQRIAWKFSCWGRGKRSVNCPHLSKHHFLKEAFCVPPSVD